MYEAYFKFTESPFRLNPDARYFFASARHKRALDCLKFGLSHGEGFVVVTGDIGTGKTTLIGHLLATLPQARYVAASIVSSHLDADDLLHMLSDSFGLPHDGASKATLLLRLQRHFEHLAGNGAKPLIIVDEAQNLPSDALEELRMLSNARIGHTSTPLTILIGQPQFRQKMSDPDLLQLRQRVVASYHLGPLGPDETRQYVEHRLATAGWAGDPTVHDDVYAAVYKVTAGVPRQINLLFSRTLLLVFLDERHDMTAQDVETVAEDMRSELEGHSGSIEQKRPPLKSPTTKKSSSSAK